ncbi:DUF3800 domain-containing protein [Corynebacterium hindlerae]|uniref:DUF3800 domain-containing protein n=1 Tax=Corynebacterium hindlerae TaxID=699041 RepID=UPI001AD66DA2|nr:DUF3800 domain-containing protein [Corynebacterium hindlerae]QTH59844.1 DUF3800 domain-containing protein [Corynebacterium hindlerae]
MLTGARGWQSGEAAHQLRVPVAVRIGHNHERKFCFVNGDLNIYCDESTHLPGDGMPFMVLGAIACPTEKTKEAASRLRDLRRKHDLPSYFEIKWNKISPSKLDFYLDVIDYFFDDDDLGFRCVIAPKAELDHQRFRQTHDDWYYKMMFLLIRNVIPSSGRAFIYLDKKDTRGAGKVAKLKEVISNSMYDFDRRIVQRIQIVESHHVGLLQLSDLLLGCVNYASRAQLDSEAKTRVLHRVQERSGLKLTQTTLLTETKFNVFRWNPQE